MRSFHTRAHRGAILLLVAAFGLLAGVVWTAPARAAVASPVTTPFGIADWDRDGHQDIVMRRNSTGDLWLYPGQSVRGYSQIPPVKIGNGWNDAEFVGIGDYDRDGNVDLVIRKIANGDIWLYPGQSVRGYSYATPVRLYTGAQAASLSNLAPIGMGDWDRDGWPDLMWHEKTRGGPYSGWMVYEVPGNGQRATQSTITKAQAGMLAEGYTPFGIGDWDRNATVDALFRYSNGDLMLFEGTGTRGSWGGNPFVKIGNGWNNATLFGVADYDRDGNQDIVERNDNTGDLWLYPGQSVRGYSQIQPVKIGNGW